MKLKNYLSAKRLRRKLSKANVNEAHCNINDSFTDFNDNEMGTVTKDDLYLRPRREGGIGVRSDMTQSFSGCLPSYQSQQIQTDTHIFTSQTRDFGSQTDLQRSAYDSCQTYSPISTDPDSYFYKDSIDMIEIGLESGLENNSSSVKCLCRGLSYDSSMPSSWHYHSLPSSQSSHPVQDIHYNSLPSAVIQSSNQPATSHQCDKWKRSRIKTNPWLPLPKTGNSDTLRRTRNVNSRAEPRLSRFFSEVEELMREQLSTEADDMRYDSSDSIASTCSTATEIPERKLEEDQYLGRGSLSEGYKSACGSSDLNLADTESFSDESRGSSTTDLSAHCSSDLESSHSINGHYPPSLQDFNTSLNSNNCMTWSSNSLISESMFGSSYSPKYEALEDKVRKLCQSTSDLDEKMRLARLECSYIQTLS